MCAADHQLCQLAASKHAMIHPSHCYAKPKIGSHVVTTTAWLYLVQQSGQGLPGAHQGLQSKAWPRVQPSIINLTGIKINIQALHQCAEHHTQGHEEYWGKLLHVDAFTAEHYWRHVTAQESAQAPDFGGV
jgi:hypothetical protein